MNRTPDLLILGGGPGGSAAAITAAVGGLSVVLVERAAFPRHRPGETLHPGVEPLLERLGVAAAVHRQMFPRHAGHLVSWQGARRFVSYGSDERGAWQGFQAWRSTFDRILLEQAEREGVVVRQPLQATRARLTDDGTIGVETKSGGWFRPRFVIDATGQHRWLVRQLGLRLVRPGPRRTAWYGYVNATRNGLNDAPTLRGTRDGWTWTARVGDDLHHWTAVWLDGRRPSADWVPAELDVTGGSIHTPRRGVQVGCEIVDAPAGSGYFAVGDAAAVLDPLCGHGVLRAVMSGILAGHLALEVIVRRQDPERAAACYNAWHGAWIVRDLGRLSEFYAALVASDPIPRDQFGSAYSSRTLQEGPEWQPISTL